MTCYSTRKKFLLVQKRSLLHTQTYCILKNTEKFPSSLPCHSQALVWKFSHRLTRTNCFRFTRAFSVSSSLSLGSEAFGAFSASRIDTEGRQSDNLAWSWGIASLQQSSIAIGTALTATESRSLTHAVRFKGHA